MPLRLRLRAKRGVMEFWMEIQIRKYPCGRSSVDR